MKAGAIDFLAKPFCDQDVLAAVIRRSTWRAALTNRKRQPKSARERRSSQAVLSAGASMCRRRQTAGLKPSERVNRRVMCA